MGSIRTDGGNDAEWHVGIAERVITPEQSMWMAGFGARDKPSEGVLNDLHTKAIAIEDLDGHTNVIVSVEILFVGRTMRKRIVNACEAEYDLPGERIMLNASHTHQGPVTRTATEATDGGERIPKHNESVHFMPIEYYGVDETFRQRTVEYRDWLIDTVVDVIGEALAAKQPAALGYGHGHCGSAMSRRRPGEDGILFRPYTDGPADHEVPVLVVSDPDADGQDPIRGLVFGYACHTSTEYVFQFSGDWVSYAYEFLEDRFPHATPIFLMGCAGDQKAYPQRQQEYIEHHARAVSVAIEAALASQLRPVHGPLRAAYEEIDINFEGPPSDAELDALAASDKPGDQWKADHLRSAREAYGEIPTTYPYPVQTFGFGQDLTMVAIAGEPLVGYSLRLKSELEGPAWISGYSNNAFTYVPTRQALPEGGYEAETVIGNAGLPGKWQPDVEDRVVAAVHALAERVHTP